MSLRLFWNFDIFCLLYTHIYTIYENTTIAYRDISLQIIVQVDYSTFLRKCSLLSNLVATLNRPLIRNSRMDNILINRKNKYSINFKNYCREMSL